MSPTIDVDKDHTLSTQSKDAFKHLKIHAKNGKNNHIKQHIEMQGEFGLVNLDFVTTTLENIRFLSLIRRNQKLTPKSKDKI